jgi:hypothetical protein
MKPLMFLAGLILCCAQWVPGITRYVSPAGANIPPYTNWADAATEINSAVAAAQAYDTIVVTNGIYAETNTVILSVEGLSMRSVNGPENTIIDGGGMHRVISLQTEGILDGFTITNGFIDAFDVGAGLTVNRGTAMNCIIAGNRAKVGAGIGVTSGEVDSCIVMNNSASHVAGGILAAESGAVRNSLIIGNTVTGIGSITELYFGGGGVLSYNGGIFNDCVISGNYSANFGGGIAILTNGNFQRCTIINNSAAVSGGGALCVDGGYIESCLFSGNSAINGGGIYSVSNAKIQNCTIVNNSAAFGGGAYFYSGGYTVNSILYFNTAPTGANYFVENAATFSFCCTIPTVSNIYDSGNCFTNDPLFINYPVNDFHLPAFSPCVDSGTNLPGLRQYMDLDGNGRVSNIVDRGAYERGLPAPHVAITSLPMEVSYDITSMGVAGTNNPSVAGGMWIENDANGIVSNFSRAGTSWVSPELPLHIGTNRFTVYATNSEGFITYDVTHVRRLGPGTGLPYVNITNKHSSVFHDQNVFFVSGTNTINVVGSMWLTNTHSGYYEYFTSTPDNWFSVAVHLDTGTNDVYVYATNVYGYVTNDMIRLVRLQATGTPVISITTDVSSVTYDTSFLQLAGTHNGQVTGYMWARNATLGVTVPFAAMESWIAPGLPLQVGANELYVYGSNLVNQVTNDMITVTRGIPGTGTPFVNETNTLTHVDETTLSFAAAGTNNANVVGTMWVNNIASGETQTFAAAASWTAPAVSLSYGLNDIEIYGTNMYGEQARDLLLITRRGQATGPPFVDITSTSTWGTYDLSSFSVEGTNNQHVTGVMWVSNAASHQVLYFSSQPTWTSPPVPLNVSANPLWVFGENAAGTQAYDTVTVYRDVPGTGIPKIYITNGNHHVTYDVAAYRVAGTNNANILDGGTMWITNALTGLGTSFTAVHAWQAPVLSLNVGTNVFTVYATNIVGTVGRASTVIIREPPGSGLPYIEIFAPNQVITSENDTLSLNGTNNANVVGSMWVTNTVNGSSAVFDAVQSWTTPDIAIDFGTNVFAVYGTNYYNQITNDTAVIIRRQPGFGAPVITITTTNMTVSFDVNSIAVTGENNLNVKGVMWLVNGANGETHNFAATQSWTATPVSLDVGLNDITVYGTNYLSDVTNDTVFITRNIPGTGVPNATITSDVTTVSYDTETYVVAGTNNMNVVGTMWVSNDASTAVHTFPAAPAWTSPAIQLNRHINVLSVFGTNLYGDINIDTITVDRPFPVGVTNFVSTTGSHEWPFITRVTAATNIIDAAVTARDSNTVLIDSGMYMLNTQLVINKDIIVLGEHGCDNTIIHAGSGINGSAVRVTTGILDGITLKAADGTAISATNGGGVYLGSDCVLRNSIVNGFTAYTFGGGVFCSGGVVSNCIIRHNRSLWHGGGVYMDADGSVSDCRIEHNRALMGGGIYLFYQGTISRCSFSDNFANTNESIVVEGDAAMPPDMQQALAAQEFNGGGAFMENGGVMTACSLRGNGARNGSGLYILSRGTAVDCTFEENISEFYAAVYCEYGGTLYSCKILNNVAYNTGGVIFDQSGQARNCLVAGNAATDIGGLYANGNVTIENCTISGNSATDSIGGASAVGGAVLRNCIIYHNTAPDSSNLSSGDSSAVVQYSCVQPAYAGEGNITNDPALAQPHYGFYRPSYTSPCLDAGTNLAWMAGATDLIGRPRIYNGTVDMGAYEYTIEPIAWAAPVPVDFGEAYVDYSTFVTMTVGNAGGVTLNGQIDNVLSPFAVESGQAYSLAPGARETAVISFTPPLTVRYTNTVALTGAIEEYVTLYGTGKHSLFVSPEVLDFGDVMIDDTVTNSYSLHNHGPAIIAGSVTNVMTPFTLISGSPYILNPGGSGHVIISFSPTEETGYTNMICFSGGGGRTAILYGTGVPEPAGVFLVLALLICFRFKLSVIS